MTSRKTLHDAVLDIVPDLCFGRCENILSRVLQPARRCATIHPSSLPTNLEMNMTNAKNATAELESDLAAAFEAAQEAALDLQDALDAQNLWDALDARAALRAAGVQA
jgi:hypothetical protein